MTPQEAIEALKIEQIQIEGKAVRVAKFFEGISVANEALEKQIPKKVEVIDKNYGYYSCRVCGAGITYRTHKHCYRCGQALDWGGKPNDR